MLRHRSLVPLSRQHQHALALCVRLKRALQNGDSNPITWQEEMQNIFEAEVSGHFQAEEQVLFPEAAQVPELAALVGKLRIEHATLREYFASAARRELTTADLTKFAELLAIHVRAEEGELFEGCQRAFQESKMAQLGAALHEALRLAGADRTQCSLPNRERKPSPSATSAPPRDE
jgi:hemerythrin-like domain-containing protein